MLEDMTAEQFAGWVQYERECPTGEERADLRQAAGVMWQLSPYLTDVDMPSLIHPYIEEDDTLERIERLEKAKEEVWQQLQSRNLQSTSPPTSQD